MVHVAFLMPLLPLAGFVVLVFGGRRLGDPLAGWIATAAVAAAFVVACFVLGGVLAMAATSHWVTGAKQVVGPIQGHVAGLNSPAGEPAQLGKQLFTTYLFAFVATAALLVIAVVGAVVLARRPGLSEKADRAEQAERAERSGQGVAS